jgi:hypothetical protein
VADLDLAAEVIPNVVAWLGGAGDWYVMDEIHEYADDELKRLAVTYGYFVELAAPLVTTAGQATYSQPADHIATVHAAFTWALLRSMTVGEAEALDGNWTTRTAAAPTNWMVDVSLDQIRLYHAPAGVGLLDRIYFGHPDRISSSNTVAPGLCPGVADLIALTAAAEARRRESDAQMPEVAQALDAIAALYRAAIQAYWGGGE